MGRYTLVLNTFLELFHHTDCQAVNIRWCKKILLLLQGVVEIFLGGDWWVWLVDSGLCNVPEIFYLVIDRAEA